MPWRLLENADRYMGWLVAYSGFLGPIAGIFIADYWVVRRAQLSLPDLYDSSGIYGRWNPRALMALAAGIALALVGLVVPALRPLYDYAWFVGFAGAFVVYVMLMRPRASARRFGRAKRRCMTAAGWTMWNSDRVSDCTAFYTSQSTEVIRNVTSCSQSMSGQEMVDLCKRHTIYEWSAQSAIDPIPVARAEGVYFWTPEGKRYSTSTAS